jgi:hypothetical protein
MAQTKVKLVSDGVITVDNLHTNHGITTDHVGEGSNLYYSEARIQNYLNTNDYITRSEISGGETLTSLSLAANTLSYLDEAGNTTNLDLSLYLDDTNLARLVSGTLDGATGIATFVRDDATTFTVDLSSLTPSETDPVFTASAASGITLTNISNWDTAYGWGDHASVGYLTSFTETDPTVPSHVKAITTTKISNWDTAFGWGNHASAGYQSASTAITTGNIGSQSVANAVTLDGRGVGAGTNNIPYLGSTRNLVINNPEDYTGEVRLGAAWNYGGVYASSTLTMASSSDINFVISNAVYANLTTSYLQHNASSRAPIFYDSNDTGYYLDPNTTGTSVKIRGGIDQFSLVGRPAAVWGSSGTNGGAVVIKFPGGTGNYGMIHAVIDIYEYSGDNGCTVIVSGHNWNGAWYNFGAQIIGTTNKQVRLGVKDGKYCIVIGDGSSSWSYGQVVLRKIQNGDYYRTIMDVSSGYTVGIETDSYSWISGDLRKLSISGAISSTSQISAPIFYDSNDTNSYFGGSGYGRLVIRGTSPTIYFRDTNENSAMLHCNSNLLYVLRGGNDTIEWTQVNGQWPATWNLTNNLYSGGGAATFVGDVTANTSDRRLKENIENIPDAIDKVKSLNGVTFDWKDNLEEIHYTRQRIHDVGVIAQEVQAVLPDAVRPAPFDTDEEGNSRSGENYLTVQYEKIVPLLIEAVKEQQNQIEELKLLINK